MARISDLVKTYRLVNDPNAPPWSVRFVGALVVVAVALAGTGAYVALRAGSDEATPAAAAQRADAGDGHETVRLDLAPGATLDDALAAVDAWKALHPGANVVAQSAIYEDGRLVGVEIRHQT